MRHRIAGKQLSRDSDHRRAMLRNLAAGLFEHGEIETTMPKAKAVQPFVEKIITTARKGTLASRRQLESTLNDRKIHSWVADANVKESKKVNAWFDLPSETEIKFNRYGEVKKAPRLVQHIIKTVAPMFEGRDGGYTRIIKTGRHRLGDGTDLVLLQLVGREDGPQIGGGTSKRREKADKRTEFAKKVGGTSIAAAAAVAEPQAAEAVVELPADETADAPEETSEE